MGDVLGRRIAAAAIDAAVILILLVVVAKTLGDEEGASRSIWAETEGSPRAVFFVLAFAYYFGTELVWAQTVGKRVMKLRVVGPGGAKLTAGPALIRNLVRFVDWLPGLYIVGAHHGLRDRPATRAARRHGRQDEGRRRGHATAATARAARASRRRRGPRADPALSGYRLPPQLRPVPRRR